MSFKVGDKVWVKTCGGRQAQSPCGLSGRHIVDCAGSACQPDGKEELVEVLALAASGVRVRTEDPFGRNGPGAGWWVDTQFCHLDVPASVQPAAGGKYPLPKVGDKILCKTRLSINGTVYIIDGSRFMNQLVGEVVAEVRRVNGNDDCYPIAVLCPVHNVSWNVWHEAWRPMDDNGICVLPGNLRGPVYQRKPGEVLRCLSCGVPNDYAEPNRPDGYECSGCAGFKLWARQA